MRILELCLSRDLGGLELYAYRCTEALAGTDHVVGVIHPQGRLRGYFEKAKLPVLFMRHRFRPLPLLAARRLARIIDREAIEVIHVHHGKDLPLAAFAKAMSRRKPALVYTRQMQLTRPKQDAYHRFLYRQLDRLLTITEALAASARDRLPASDRQKVATLYYGVKAPTATLTPDERRRIRAEWGLPEDGFVVGLFGRKEEAKGQHLLLEALAQLRGRGVTVCAILVGHAMNPAYAGRLEDMVKTLGLESQVAFRDFVDAPQRWMQACDCVALTTYEETFGLVLAEAMRAGVAVLGSNSGGVPEIIEHEHSGLLFTPGDSAALAEQLLRLQADEELRENLARQGKEKADRLFVEGPHYAGLREQFAALISATEPR